ncbi:alpha-galactosidase [Kitasatospora sp. YST-16]|uniref:alpha-galactosidase n=1 Tax=Kitasatospora sp. YST-16 TaxID=2998080 RepID=UPI002284DDB2|nr:alpha-galactosidase [Kitasatospora sp. YST-16]WAL72821.1 alpha-galactosidase [Kitasatospora sp. YST-16]WNW38871.1 alpha-galactosidase [Streptomyces sp. Li-HN-5-13]
MKVLPQMRLVVRFESGRESGFGPFVLGEAVDTARTPESPGVSVGAAAPHRVTVRPPDGERIASVEYLLRAPMGNFDQVVPPDSGRWFMNLMHATGFWKHGRLARSKIDDVKVPLYLFTGRDGNVELAMGVVGDLVETDLRLLEPVSDRALNVHTGGVEVGIRRGTEEYPLPGSVLAADGSLTEYVYLRSGPRQDRSPWLDVLRDFSERTRSAFGPADRLVPASFDPFWCSWTDWASDDIGEEMVLENVRIGLDLGVRNFIIDDGWFGPGLDTAYETPLNIGDWTPDPAKFPDLPQLVRRIDTMGGRAVIWCAPHAVGPAAACFADRRRLLIAPRSGEPVLGETQFHSLCFMNAEARRTMADICVRLAREYGFHGAKYDLFNWIPDLRCESPHHEHDLESMLTGLRLMLADADRRTREVSPDHIVELKQNYGTALLTPYGTCMRAGDAPFDPRTNFLRTLHVQAYTPAALNDYQTFGPDDTPQDVAVSVITMLAAGIPAYGADFTRLPEQGRDVLRWYHRLYADNMSGFLGHRTVHDSSHGVLRAAAAEQDVVFVLQPSTACRIDRPSLVLNGGYATRLTVDARAAGLSHTVLSPSGVPLAAPRPHPGGPLGIDVPPGGGIRFARPAGNGAAA